MMMMLIGPTLSFPRRFVCRRCGYYFGAKRHLLAALGAGRRRHFHYIAVAAHMLFIILRHCRDIRLRHFLHAAPRTAAFAFVNGGRSGEHMM